MACISETLTRLTRYVQPRHANILGRLHGGILMSWMTEAAAMSAARFSRGPVVLGTIDDLFFLVPIEIGSLVHAEAKVTYKGGSSMDVVVDVFSENPATGETVRTTHATMAYVAVDEDIRPRRFEARLEPCSPEEYTEYKEAGERHRRRKSILASPESEWPQPLPGLPLVETYRRVYPEDAFFGDWMSAGSLLRVMDEVGAIAASRYARGPVVTGSVDRIVFHKPVRVGEILRIRAFIDYVGRTSMETAIEVDAFNPYTGDERSVCTAYYTFIHLGGDGRPRPVKPYTPPRGYSEQWARAAERRKRRIERLRTLKERWRK